MAARFTQQGKVQTGLTITFNVKIDGKLSPFSVEVTIKRTADDYLAGYDVKVAKDGETVYTTSLTATQIQKRGFVDTKCGDPNQAAYDYIRTQL